MRPSSAFLALALSAGACAAPATRAVRPAPPPPAAHAAAAPTLARLDAELERLMTAHSLAEWHEYTGEGEGDPAALDRLRADERRLFERARPLAEAVLARADAPALERRRATLWRDGALGMALAGDPESARLAQQLETALDHHAFVRDGRTLTRAEVGLLARSADPAERRAGWALQSALHAEVAPIARALLRRRAALARALGLASFTDEMLALRGIEPATWQRLSDAFLAGTRARYAALLARGAAARGLPALAPWDLALATSATTAWADPHFAADNALPFARTALGAMGFDLDHPPVRVEVREFAFGGQTLSIHVPDDVRTVVRPQTGVGFYGTLLHELGHGLQATRTAAPDAVFKGYEWVPGLTAPGFDEGVAEVFGTLLDEPGFLRARAGLSAEESARLSGELRGAALVRLRGIAAQAAFEREALADPEQDLDALQRRIDREVRLLRVPDDAPPTWAATPFLATYPVYVQSYVVAAMVAAQVHAALRERFGERFAEDPAAGRFLAETLFAPGDAIPWEQRLAAATGHELAPDALIARLTTGAAQGAPAARRR